ncbi:MULTISPECIES: hypothetical protein [Streptomyces]|uniref:hypothetical protein n=1 Tax=Streptomyces TaxID=1883 RepID=UPI0021A82C49|nr:hypothetical protein [Streptomyces atratus]MCT2546720.1 hypothetical protein [Streptomyces atratus]
MPNHEEAIGPAIAMLSEALHRADVNAGFGPCPAADLQTVDRNLPLPAELLSLYGTCGPLGTVNVPPLHLTFGPFSIGKPLTCLTNSSYDSLTWDLRGRVNGCRADTRARFGDRLALLVDLPDIRRDPRSRAPMEVAGVVARPEPVGDVSGAGIP